MDPAQVTLLGWDWEDVVHVQAGPRGLINQTWIVHGPTRPWAVLQQLNTKVFDPIIHENIEAVTRHVAARGLETPRLRLTRKGQLWHEAEDRTVWRVLTWVGDRTEDKLSSAADARAAGALVARFHAATSDFDWEFKGTHRGFHDTASRMGKLEDALARHPRHRLFDQVAPLAEKILRGWAEWRGPDGLPSRVVHGDLKISNIRFRGGDAIALIDLDTLGRGSLDAELGDALRSWCNPAHEDQPARFDQDLFASAIRGYADRAEGVELEEWESIVPGIERITLELAARFAADVLDECYWAYDSVRFGSRGEHNLVRASGQLDLARQIQASRSVMETCARSVWQSIQER